MNFRILINPDALQDIQEAFEWYNSRQVNLGQEFLFVLHECFNLLRSSPRFQIRYANIRCLPLKGYPYMIHFTLDKSTQTVVIRAVINTHRDPKIWKER